MSPPSSDTPPEGFEVGLQGWDTANVVHFDIVNQSIKAQGSTPASFKAEDDFDGQLKGDWDTWQLIPDPDIGSARLAFRCSITKGAYINLDAEMVDLAGAVVYVSILLSAIPAPDAKIEDKTASKESSGKIFKLVAPSTEMRKLHPPGGRDETIPPVITTKVVLNGEASHDNIEMIKGMFTEWFDANLNQFNNVFHLAILSAKAAKGHFQWLKPTSLSYAGVTNNSDNGVLAALCETDCDKPTRTVQQVDAAIMRDWPEGANSVIAISGEKFAQKVLLTGARQVLKGSVDEDFDLVGNGLVVTNNKELPWQNLQIDDETIVTPTVPAGGLTMSVHQDCIRLEFTNVTFKLPLMFGNDIVQMDFTQNYGVRLGRNDAGEAVLMATCNVPSQTPPETAEKTQDLPNVQNVNFSVRPDQDAMDASRTMQMVLICATIVGAGYMAEGVFAARTAATAAAIEEAGTAAELLSAGEALEVGMEIAPEAFAAGGLEGNLAAAAAITAGAEGAMPLGFAMFSGLLTQAAALAALSLPVLMVIEGWEELDDQKIDENHVPSLDDFVDNILGASSWPDTDGWELIDVRLANSLLFYGELSPKQAATPS